MQAYNGKDQAKQKEKQNIQFERKMSTSTFNVGAKACTRDK